MRLSHALIFAGALVTAAPALAQANAAAPGNTVSTQGLDANAAANTTATNSTAAGATAADANTTATEAPGAPPHIATPADTGTTMAVKTHRGFPWGVLGLLGLIGLFGVRKVKD